MKPLRLGLTIAAFVAGLLAVSVGFAAWLAMTESGTVWLVARLEQRIPAPVAFGSIGGTLWNGIELSDVNISTDAVSVAVDVAELEVSLAELLQRRVIIERLDVGAIRYEQRTSDSDARGPIDVPLEIAVDAGAIETLTIVLDGEEWTLGPATFVGHVEGDTVIITALEGSALGFAIQGAATIVLDDALEIDTAFEWSTVRNGTEYAGRGGAVGTWPLLTVNQDIAAPIEVAADGSVSFGESPNAELELTWNEVQWPWAANIQSAGGQLQVAGWLDSVAFDGDASLIVDDIAADVTASGTATLTEVVFDRLDAFSQFGSVESAGRLVAAPLEWSFDVSAEGVDPSVRLPDWPGALDIVGRLSGRVEPELGVALSDATVSGSLRGRPVDASGSVAYTTPGAWQFETLIVETGANRLALTGTLDAAIDLEIDVDATDLASLIDSASGALTVDGALTGSRLVPAFRGAAAASDVTYGAYGVSSVAIDGEVIADQARTVSLNLEATGARIGDRQIDTVAGSVRGNAGDHVVDIEMTAEYGDATFQARGAWADRTWSGNVTTLALTEPTLGHWQLDAPTAVTATRAMLALDRACVNQDRASLCASTRIGTDDDMLEVALRSFNLEVLASVLPDGISMSGVYDADLALAGPLRQPTGQFSARGANSVITIHEPDQPPLEIPIETLRADAELAPSGDLNLDMAFDSSNGGSFDVTAGVIALWSEAPTVAGEISGRWPDLAFLSLLSPDVGEVTGTGSVDLMLDGPLRDPQLSGSARWLAGRLEVPRFGLAIEDIEATIASAGSTALSIDASGDVGSGQLSITGTTQLDADAGWPTSLQIFGERLEAVRLPEAQILLTPALAVEAALPNINVSGAFLVPQARLTLDELPPQAAVPSPDTVVHDVAREAGPRPLNVRADIRVGLGDDVRYTGAGLDVALAGAMGVTYQSGEAAIASGAVTLSGQYQAYGQTLEIEEGRLLFAGPLANPNLDVRAVRRIDETTAGIQLSGTVEAPVSRVFSEPAMAEADALAFLLLGRPLSTTGDEETATLETAAFAMGLQQALPVIERVGESLGLDEFGVQTTSADTGELMAGKRISPRIYIRYSYGLFNRIGGLLMQFSLNNRFSLETRSGDNRSMDLIYTVERD